MSIVVTVVEQPVQVAPVEPPASPVVVLAVEQGPPGPAPARGTALLDFGTGAVEASVAVVDAGATEASAVLVSLAAEDTVDRTAAEVRGAAASAALTLSVAPPVAGVGFTIYGTSAVLLAGTLPVRWCRA